MTAPTGQLKGSMYVSTFAFIETRFGPNAKSAVLARLEPADRELLGGLVLPISWYPLAPFGRLLRAMDAELGRGDHALIVERGEWTAVRDMRTIHKVILKFVTMTWIVDKAAKLWPSFHDTGRWEVRRVAEKRAAAELFDLAVVDDAICSSLHGWILGLGRLTGTRRVDLRHSRCRARGATSCVFDLTWI